MHTQEPKVAIVILNYNTASLLNQFLPFVVNTEYKNLEIIVADNGSTDNSAAVVKNYKTVQWMPLGNNYGYAGGYNKALKSIMSDYYMLLNSDVEVEPDWIKNLVDAIKNLPNCAALQPKIKSLKNKEAFEYAGAAGGFIDILGYPFCRGRIFNHCENDHGQYDNNLQVFWASGAALFIDAKIFWQVGAFDNLLFAHMEEIDLCYRIQLSDYKIYCAPKAVVYHLGGGTLAEQNEKKTYLNFRNSLVLMARYEKGFTKYIKIFLRLILDAPAAILYLSKGRIKDVLAIVRAHWHFLFYFNKWQKQVENFKPKENVNLFGKFNFSIVIAYYLKGHKTFFSLQKNKKLILAIFSLLTIKFLNSLYFIIYV